MAIDGINGAKGFQPDSDVHVSYEDQQKINRFAKHNAKFEDYKRELEIRKNELKSLEEACEEIELLDENERIPYQNGEVFVSHGLTEVQGLLAEEKAKNQKEIIEIEEKCSAIQHLMNDLKAQLYHRFGNNISLENDD